MGLVHPTRSERIKRGIRRARLAGKVIGANGRRLAAENHATAITRAAELFPIVVEFRHSGLSYRRMVARLNARGEATPGQTGHWHVRTLQRLMARADEAEPQLAHEIIARSDVAEGRAGAAETVDARVAAVLARTRELRETRRAMRHHSQQLIEDSRVLRADLHALRVAGLDALREATWAPP